MSINLSIPEYLLVAIVLLGFGILIYVLPRFFYIALEKLKYLKRLSIRREGVDLDFYKEEPGEYFDGISTSPRKEMKSAFETGLKLYRKNQYKEALTHFEEALKKNPSDEERLAIYNTMGVCNNIRGNNDLAEEQLKFVLDHARKKNVKVIALGNIGLIYSDKGELGKALKYQKDALKLHKEIGNRLGEASDLGNIGLIYSDKGEPEKALKYQKDALKIDKEIGNRLGEASDLGNIGNIYRGKGELEKALKYLEDALKIFKVLGAKHLIRQAESIITIIKSKQKNH